MRNLRNCINNEEMDLKFESNKGRDEFIKSLLDAVDNIVTLDDINEISELLDS